MRFYLWHVAPPVDLLNMGSEVIVLSYEMVHMRRTLLGSGVAFLSATTMLSVPPSESEQRYMCMNDLPRFAHRAISIISPSSGYSLKGGTGRLFMVEILSKLNLNWFPFRCRRTHTTTYSKNLQMYFSTKVRITFLRVIALFVVSKEEIIISFYLRIIHTIT